jgi:hypothetical protein
MLVFRALKHPHHVTLHLAVERASAWLGDAPDGHVTLAEQLRRFRMRLIEETRLRELERLRDELEVVRDDLRGGGASSLRTDANELARDIERAIARAAVMPSIREQFDPPTDPLPRRYRVIRWTLWACILIIIVEVLLLRSCYGSLSF